MATRTDGRGVASGAAVSAFAIGIALMPAFVVADEIFIAQLLSLLAVVLLPDAPASGHRPRAVRSVPDDRH